MMGQEQEEKEEEEQKQKQEEALFVEILRRKGV